MWNAVANEIPEWQIRDEHIRVLEHAVENAEEFGIGGPEVQKAIEYFRARTSRQGGINLFLYGMRENRIEHLREGLRLMKKHSGIER